MKSEWKVEKNIINGVEMYRAYRVIDVTQVNHSGNREYIGNYIEDQNLLLRVTNVLNGLVERR